MVTKCSCGNMATPEGDDPTKCIDCQEREELTEEAEAKLDRAEILKAQEAQRAEQQKMFLQRMGPDALEISAALAKVVHDRVANTPTSLYSLLKAVSIFFTDTMYNSTLQLNTIPTETDADKEFKLTIANAQRSAILLINTIFSREVPPNDNPTT